MKDVITVKVFLKYGDCETIGISHSKLMTLIKSMQDKESEKIYLASGKVLEVVGILIVTNEFYKSTRMIVTGAKGDE